jgi:hypothetical protein
MAGKDDRYRVVELGRMGFWRDRLCSGLDIEDSIQPDGGFSVQLIRLCLS